MDISLSDKDLYVFGSFVLDPLKRSLLRDGLPVPLSPKVFDTLLYLVENTDRLLDKDELLDAVWPGRIVEENNLSHNISLLRKALGGDGALDRCIVTSPGRGYRFTATLRRVPRVAYPDAVVAAGGEETHCVAGEGNGAVPHAGPPRRWRRLVWAGTLPLLALAGLLAYLAAARFAPAPTTPASIAVLPFKNLSADSHDAYFAAGVQDEILTRLTRVGGMKVISRTSSEQYGSRPRDLQNVARELGVANVLEGSVQRSGNRIRVNVQLIDAATDAHLWAQTYDRDAGDVFEVETDVAARVTAALKLTLLPVESAAIARDPTRNAEAYDLFLRAEFLRRKNFNHTPMQMDAAIDLYSQAIARDPDFALAYARRSIARSFLFWRGSSKMSRQMLADAALADARKALALQPALSDAHAAMGFYHARLLDYPGAMQSYRIALELRPNDASAMLGLADAERRLGRWDAAIGHYESAIVLDPNGKATASDLAFTYCATRRYALAERVFRRALALDPADSETAAGYAECILAESGDTNRALSLLQSTDPEWLLEKQGILKLNRDYKDAISVITDLPDVPTVFSFSVGPKALMLGLAYSDAGDNVRARPLLLRGRAQVQAELAAQPENFAGRAYIWLNLAMADAALGDPDAALAAAGKAAAILPPGRDSLLGQNVLGYVARIDARLGRADLALPLIERLLSSPGAGEDITPALLRLEPVWDRIRDNLRFQALSAKPAGGVRTIVGRGT